MIDKLSAIDLDEWGAGFIAVFIGSFLLLHGNVIASLIVLAIFLLTAAIYIFRDDIKVFISDAEEIFDDLHPESPEVDITGLTVGGDDTLQLGFYGDSKVPVRQPIGHIGNIFLCGMTRYGKTREIYGLVYDLIVNNTPDEVLLGFSDAKRVSFMIFDKLDHLFAPIATTADETEKLLVMAKKEMERRFALFAEYDGKVCTNINEYRELSGETIPRIILFFDEAADSIEKDSESEEILTTIAKMGLASGIHIVVATQRPTAKGISHEVQSQCATTLCTYMRDSLDYGIAKIPATVYKDMTATKGLFMIFSPETAPMFADIYDKGGWGYIMGNYIENEVMEETAIKYSSQKKLHWQGRPKLPTWTGSKLDKFKAIDTLAKQIGKMDIDDDDLVKAFGIQKRTAGNWITKYNDYNSDHNSNS